MIKAGLFGTGVLAVFGAAVTAERIFRVPSDPLSAASAASKELPTPGLVHKPPVFQAGFSLLIYENTPETVKKCRNLIDQAVEMNANSISLNFPFFQKDARSSAVYTLADKTPSESVLGGIAEEAHRKGLSVMIQPALDEATTGYRGSIEPVNSHDWFESYGDLVENWAKLCQRMGIETFLFGKELDNTEHSTGEWENLIRNRIRRNYSGALSYGFNWNDQNKGGLVEVSPEVLNYMDFIGVDAWYGMNVPPKPEPIQVTGALNYWRNFIHKSFDGLKKNVIFTEIGYKSEADSLKAPYGWPPKGAVDLGLQELAYQKMFEVMFPPNGPVMGMYIWNLPVYQPGYSALADNGFNPWGKPAQKVIAENYKRLKQLTNS